MLARLGEECTILFVDHFARKRWEHGGCGEGSDEGFLGGFLSLDRQENL
jgi:hypothetical protein